MDEHPRYHVAELRWLAGRETIPLPLDEARTDGFTPCAVCSPDRTLAERARARRHTQGTPSRGSPRAASGRRTGALLRHGPARSGSPPVPRCPGRRRPSRRAPWWRAPHRPTAPRVLERLGQHPVAGPPDLDPVADLQAGVLAGLLEEPDDLAHQAGRSSSGVSVRSSATVRPAPLATVQPSRGVSVTIRSPSSRGTATPPTSTVALPAR